MHEKNKYRHIPWNRYNLEKYRDINFWSYRPALNVRQLFDIVASGVVDGGYSWKTERSWNTSLKMKNINSEVSVVLSNVTVKIRLFPFDSCLLDFVSVTLARKGNLSSKTQAWQNHPIAIVF